MIITGLCSVFHTLVSHTASSHTAFTHFVWAYQRDQHTKGHAVSPGQFSTLRRGQPSLSYQTFLLLLFIFARLVRFLLVWYGRLRPPFMLLHIHHSLRYLMFFKTLSHPSVTHPISYTSLHILKAMPMEPGSCALAV